MNGLATLQDRYAEVCAKVRRAAERSGRRAEDVLIVAVSKYAAPEPIRQLVDMGHRDFGENNVQQLQQRVAMVDEYLDRLRVLSSTQAETGSDREPADRIRWHMIGHLQRNKAKKASELSRLVHSVDSLRLAEELQQIGLRRERDVDVLVQVNCSGEESKFGCAPAATSALIEQISAMTYVRVRGLMTMAAYSDNPEAARPTFARCRELFDDVRREAIIESGFDILSMGMSGDYEPAIEEGANLVRIGSGIFGAREDAGE